MKTRDTWGGRSPDSLFINDHQFLLKGKVLTYSPQSSYWDIRVSQTTFTQLGQLWRNEQIMSAVCSQAVTHTSTKTANCCLTFIWRVTFQFLHCHSFRVRWRPCLAKIYLFCAKVNYKQKNRSYDQVESGNILYNLSSFQSLELFSYIHRL